MTTINKSSKGVIPMVDSEIIAHFMASLQVSEMPNEYIKSAKITDAGGDVKVLTGEVLTRLLNHHPDYKDIKMAIVFLNMHKVYTAIETEVDYIYEIVEKIYSENPKED